MKIAQRQEDSFDPFTIFSSFEFHQFHAVTRQPPWLLIAALAALLFLPGFSLRLIAGLAQGFAFFIFLVPLIGGLLGWLWWRSVQSKIKISRCPSCASLTMNSAICPSCGYDLSNLTDVDKTENSDVIDVKAEALDD